MMLWLCVWVFWPLKNSEEARKFFNLWGTIGAVTLLVGISMILMMLGYLFESIILWSLGVAFPVFILISILKFILKRLFPTSSFVSKHFFSVFDLEEPNGSVFSMPLIFCPLYFLAVFSFLLLVPNW